MVKGRQGQDQGYTLNLFFTGTIFMLFSKLQHSKYKQINVLKKSWLELIQYNKKCIYSIVTSFPKD